MWCSHTRNTSADKCVRRVADCNPMSRRKRDIPRRLWQNEADEAMEARDLRNREWEDLEKWRNRLIETSLSSDSLEKFCMYEEKYMRK